MGQLAVLFAEKAFDQSSLPVAASTPTMPWRVPVTIIVWPWKVTGMQELYSGPASKPVLVQMVWPLVLSRATMQFLPPGLTIAMFL